MCCIRQFHYDMSTNLQHKQASHHEGTEHSQETIDRSRIKTRETWKPHYNVSLKWHFPLNPRALNYPCNILCLHAFLNRTSNFLFSCSNTTLAGTICLLFLSKFSLLLSFEVLCCQWAAELSLLTLPTISNANWEDLVINKVRLLESTPEWRN